MRKSPLARPGLLMSKIHHCINADSRITSKIAKSTGPGGFHPVHLGDALGEDNRFRVIDKLGNGGFSTVWLCRDQKKNKYVALKIITANASKDDCPEMALLNRTDMDWTQAGGKYIALPHEHFWIEGPNGGHLCLVLEVLGPRVPTIWQAFPDPHKTAKDIILPVTKGLQFLHRNGLCHGDFRPSNILLRIQGFGALSETDITSVFGEPVREPILTISGEIPGPSAPRYVVQPIKLDDLGSKHFTDQACLIEFGEVYSTSSPPSNLGITLEYCSPELIFENYVGIGCDLWALACTIYELRSCSKFFESFSGEVQDVIILMLRILGILPDKWWSIWEERDRYCEERVDETDILPPLSLERLLAEGVHFEVDEKKIDIVVEPDERVVLTDLLMQLFEI